MRYTWLTDTVTSDLDRALHYTLLWGLDAVELRTVGKAGDRVPHVNEEKLRRRLLEHEIEVSAVVPGLFEGPVSDRVSWLNDLAALPETVRFCERIGCRTILASSFAGEDSAEGFASQAADALRRAGEITARSGLTLAVMNAADALCATGSALAQVLEAVDHPNVRAAWQPAEAVRAGEDLDAGLDAVAPYLAYVRCTDIDLDGGPVPFGEGVVPWAKHLAALHQRAYRGPLSLEIRGTPPAKAGVRGATRLIQLDRTARPTT